MVTSREVRLKSRPVGMPTADDFEIITMSVPGPGLGEVQVNNLRMTVDPYMRGRMEDRPKVVPSRDRIIGKITASNATMFGWRPAFRLGEVLQGSASAKLPLPTIQTSSRRSRLDLVRLARGLQRGGGRFTAVPFNSLQSRQERSPPS